MRKRGVKIMSDELRDLLNDFALFIKGNSDYTLEKALEDINAWHIRERKKWAINIIEEAKKFLLTTKSISMSSKIGVGITIAEIREEMEG